MDSIKNIKTLIKEAYLTPEEIIDIKKISKESLDIIRGLSPFHAAKIRKHKVDTILDLANIDIDSFSDPNVEKDQLLKWKRIAELFIYFEKLAIDSKEVQEPVLLFVGLEDSGKTALIETLLNMKASTSTYPTKQIVETKKYFLGTEFRLKDLPGDKTLREEYFEDPENVFENPFVIFFLVDSTKQTKVSEVIQYFDRIISFFDLKGKHPFYSFLITKYDQEYRHQLTDQQSTDAHARMRIKELMKKFNLKNYEINNISIFQSDTIVQSFYKTFRKVSITTKILDYELKYYADLYSVLGCYLVDQNGLIAGQWVQRLAEKHRKILYDEIYNAIQKLPKIDVGDKQFIFSRQQRVTYEIKERNNRANMTLIPIGKVPFYLIIADTSLENKPKTFGEEFEIKVMPWIQNYFVDFSNKSK